MIDSPSYPFCQHCNLSPQKCRCVCKGCNEPMHACTSACTMICKHCHLPSAECEGSEIWSALPSVSSEFVSTGVAYNQLVRLAVVSALDLMDEQVSVRMVARHGKTFARIHLISSVSAVVMRASKALSRTYSKYMTPVPFRDSAIKYDPGLLKSNT